MIGSPRRRKPTAGTRIDRSDPIHRGAYGIYALLEGSGPALDSLGGLALPLQSGAAWGAGGDGVGLAGSSSGPAASEYQPISPGWPISFACRLTITATLPNYANWWCSAYGGAPYFAWCLGTGSSASDYRMFWSSGTAQVYLNYTTALTPGRTLTASGTITPSEARQYLDGVLIGTYGGPFSTPSYAAGGNRLQIAGAGALVSAARWWGRSLSDDEHARLAADPAAGFPPMYDAALLAALARGPSVPPWLLANPIVGGTP
jgi:hypothetical protein